MLSSQAVYYCDNYTENPGDCTFLLQASKDSKPKFSPCFTTKPFASNSCAYVEEASIVKHDSIEESDQSSALDDMCTTPI